MDMMEGVILVFMSSKYTHTNTIKKNISQIFNEHFFLSGVDIHQSKWEEKTQNVCICFRLTVFSQQEMKTMKKRSCPMKKLA